MGVYYYIYAEVRVGNKWYNISPLMRDREGEVKVRPVLHGQSWIRQAFVQKRRLLRWQLRTCLNIRTCQGC